MNVNGVDPVLPDAPLVPEPEAAAPNPAKPNLDVPGGNDKAEKRGKKRKKSSRRVSRKDTLSREISEYLPKLDMPGRVEAGKPVRSHVMLSAFVVDQCLVCEPEQESRPEHRWSSGSR